MSERCASSPLALLLPRNSQLILAPPSADCPPLAHAMSIRCNPARYPEINSNPSIGACLRNPLINREQLRLVRELPVETPFLNADVSSSLWLYRVVRSSRV